MSEKKKLKDNSIVKGIKTVVKYGAAIGGSALIGCLLKKADHTGVKGIAKLAIPLGIFGLAHAAGNAASDAAVKEIDGYCDHIDEIREDLEDIEVELNVSKKSSDEELEVADAEVVS